MIGNIPSLLLVHTPKIALTNSINQNLYLCGESYSNTAMTIVNSQNGGSYNLNLQDRARSFVCRFDESWDLTWRSYVNGTVYDIATFNNGVGMSGSGSPGLTLPLTQNCGLPTVGTFSICDNSGSNYIENNNNTVSGNRMFMMIFDTEDNLFWSTFYGDDNDNIFNGLSFNSDYLFTTGVGRNNTFEEFDVNSTIDYYDNVLNSNGTGVSDGTVAMFDMNSVIVGIEEVGSTINSPSFLALPNPFSNSITITSYTKVELETTIELYNSLGQLIIKSDFLTNSLTQNIDTSILEKGVYYLHVQNKKGNLFSTKILKQ